MSILVVDDSPSQRLLLTSMLRTAGETDMIAAASASDAFARLGMDGSASSSCDVDLILMDLNMPEVDGIEACQRIKAVPELQDIPIIMVTASAEECDLQLAFDAGAMDYITKPPRKSELLARVRSALKLKHEMDRRKARERELTELTDELTRVNEQLHDAFASLDSQHRLLEAEQAKSEALLLNVLPKPVADRLKSGPEVIADSFADATVLFADIVGFTQMSAQMPPRELVALLNEVFTAFDRLAEKHGLEKIKTIGDAYMVIGGLPIPRSDHTTAVAEMALDMQTALIELANSCHVPIQARFGIHAGPVVAGVIGTKKFAYDLWGDTVNLASRLESQGLPGTIQVSPVVFERLRDRYLMRERGKIDIKGRGEILAYVLCGRRSHGA